MGNFLNGLMMNAGVIGGADGPTAVFVAGEGDLFHAPTLLWQGMTGIFVVMIVISLIVYLLSKITSPKKGEGEE